MSAMCLTIVAKSELSAAQSLLIEERLSAPEHAYDNGPPKVWGIYQKGLYAAIHTESNQPIGLVEASGAKDCISPGWWLDKDFRGKGYGNKLVDTLAKYLKLEGYTGAGRIEIQTHNQRIRHPLSKTRGALSRALQPCIKQLAKQLSVPVQKC